jgi:SagB-type dehydrogenase family enzyme
MNNRDTRVALDYHEETKHSHHSVRASRHFLDWATQPVPFKRYVGLPRISLPPPRRGKGGEDALSALLQSKPYERKERVPELQDVADLLFFSAGVTRRRQGPGGEILFRAASCTGALYEIDLYVVCGDLPGVDAGVYHFEPENFLLQRLRSGDCRPFVVQAASRQADLARAPLTIISSGTYWRNAWKYRARTYRHFGWDNGTILANLLATARALEFPAKVILGFVDEEINRLLGLETAREVALSIVSLGWTSAEVPTPAVRLDSIDVATLPESPSRQDYPEMTRMHSATLLRDAREAGEWRDCTPPEAGGGNGDGGHALSEGLPEGYSGDSLQEVILRRGSSRRFSHQPIGFSELSVVLKAAGSAVATDLLNDNRLFCDCYLLVHDVADLSPGAYFYDRQQDRLRLLKEGLFRKEGAYLALEQSLAGDASVAIFFLAGLDPLLQACGNRAYRAVQLEAGILGGRVYLAAYSLRLGATGLTFYDDDVVRFFSPHAEGKSAIFLTAVGHGVKRGLWSV